ncbi:hypothetical protein [Paeniglutamicibacter sp. NPDC091659]|uniref:hypothetical protein n=1 Tax=Paeniglutamicibacter sp. NPDC091659 TaxID=3364389 RepID=UPI00382EC76A
MIFIEGPPSITDWVSAVATALTFVIALVALLYAKSQLKEASLARQQTKDLEMERSQPYVVAYTEPAAAETILDLVIKNYGLTAAYDVKIDIDPWPQRAPSEIVKLPEVIPFLAPGQEWRTMWDTSLARKDSTLPDRHEAQITYRGLGDNVLHTEAILDWGVYKSKLYMVTYGMHDLAKAVREMNKTQKKWSEFSGGLKVFSRSGDEKDARRKEEARRYREYDEAQRAELKKTLEFTANRAAQEASPPLEIESDQP